MSGLPSAAKPGRSLCPRVLTLERERSLPRSHYMCRLGRQNRRYNFDGILPYYPLLFGVQQGRAVQDIERDL